LKWNIIGIIIDEDIIIINIIEIVCGIEMNIDPVLLLLLLIQWSVLCGQWNDDIIDIIIIIINDIESELREMNQWYY